MRCSPCQIGVCGALLVPQASPPHSPSGTHGIAHTHALEAPSVQWNKKENHQQGKDRKEWL